MAKAIGCRKILFVNGPQLIKAMVDAGLDEKRLADRANVSEQTVRNYISSTTNEPWPANSRKFGRVCEALKLDQEGLLIEADQPATPNEDHGVLADIRFLGDPDKVRSIDGRWIAESSDLSIPGVVTYDNPRTWRAELTIEQYGNIFEATGIDKDEDGVFAKGSLLENGNWIRFQYWIDNPRLREYGTAMVEYCGDGNTMKGVFIGRDAGHSSTGLVVARLVLTRNESSDLES